MTRPLRVYHLPNLYGTHEAIVAALNQKEAARLMRSSFSGFKDYGGHQASSEEYIAVAMSEPGSVFQRRIPSVLSLKERAENHWRKG